MKHLHHYTLNTGHNRVSPHAEVADSVIQTMRPWLTPGEHNLGDYHAAFAGFRVVVPESTAGL